MTKWLHMGLVRRGGARLSMRSAVAAMALAAAFWAQAAIPPTPPGGTVKAMAADPFAPDRVLLGTTTGGVFVSPNGGGDWSFLAQVAPHDDWVVASLAPDPVHRGYWYAGLWSWSAPDGGIFQSTDGGRDWRPLMQGHAVRMLALAPSQPSTIVAATLDGVFRSADSGHTWQRISPPHDRELANVESVAIDPQNPREIYVGTWHLPWKTINGGHDWWEMRDGVIDDSDVFSIAVDRDHPQTLYLSACSGIYRSDNRGGLFRKIQGIPYSARRTPAIVPSPADPNTIYAGTTQGLWVTHDGGATWARITSPDLRVNSVLLLPAGKNSPPRILLGADFAGVVASNDGGRSFVPANRGFSSRHVSAAAAGPEGEYVAVTGDEGWGGIFLHSAAGWRSIPAPQSGQDVLGLHWSPAGLLASTAQGVFLLPARPLPLATIARPSRRRGRSAPPRRLRSGWIEVPSAPHDHVFALTGLTRESLTTFAATTSGLYATDDGGLSWQWMREAPAPLYALLPLAASADPPAAPGASNFTARGPAPANAPSAHWLFIAGDGYVLRSPDLGQHFIGGRLGLRGRINQIAAAPRSGLSPLLFAATTRGLYQSADLGQSWSLCGHGLPALDIASVHAQAGVIYAAAAQLGYTYASNDSGTSWHSIELAPMQRALARIAPMLLTDWQTAAASVPQSVSNR